MTVFVYKNKKYAGCFPTTDENAVKRMCYALDKPRTNTFEFYLDEERRGEPIMFWRLDGKIHGNIFHAPESYIPEYCIANHAS